MLHLKLPLTTIMVYGIPQTFVLKGVIIYASSVYQSYNMMC